MASSARITSMRTWQVAEKVKGINHTLAASLDRLLSVVLTIASRLQKWSKPASESGPRPEPAVHDTNAWPPVFDI